MTDENYELFDKCIFYNILRFIHSFLFFECVIDSVCGCLSFELVMMKVMPYDPSHVGTLNSNSLTLVMKKFTMCLTVYHENLTEPKT